MNQHSLRTAPDQIGLELVYSPMDASTAREIADRWKYPPPYDFYDMTADPEDYEEFVTPALWPEVFLQARLGGQIFSFLSGELSEAGSASVLEIGLGMHPDLTGRGLGTMFMRRNLEWIRGAYPGAGIRLSVASFNQRGIKVYRKSGFHVVRNFVRTTNGGEYDFVEMRYGA